MFHALGLIAKAGQQATHLKTHDLTRWILLQTLFENALRGRQIALFSVFPRQPSRQPILSWINGERPL
jgi:hypothetical protein